MKIKRSAVRSLSLAGADRCRTTSCWRRNANSASRAACDLNTPASNPRSSFKRSTIPVMRVAHRGSCATPDAIFGSHNPLKIRAISIGARVCLVRLLLSAKRLKVSWRQETGDRSHGFGDDHAAWPGERPELQLAPASLRQPLVRIIFSVCLTLAGDDQKFARD